MKHRTSGMSLLEIMIAMAVLSVTLLAMVSLISSSKRVQDDAGERTIAYNAARAVVEEMRALPLTEVYRRYNSSTSDNPATGTSPGATFGVDGLPRGYDGADQGRVIFPESKGLLCEDPPDKVLGAELGMPKDLNRDGDTVDTGLSAYDILPVKVEVRWVVPGGKVNRIHVITLIAER